MQFGEGLWYRLGLGLGLSAHSSGLGLGIGLGETWALAFVFLIGLEALFRLSTELYSVWFFARNTLGGLGLTWLVFERIANAHRQ